MGLRITQRPSRVAHRYIHDSTLSHKARLLRVISLVSFESKALRQRSARLANKGPKSRTLHSQSRQKFELPTWPHCTRDQPGRVVFSSTSKQAETWCRPHQAERHWRPKSGLSLTAREPALTPSTVRISLFQFLLALHHKLHCALRVILLRPSLIIQFP